MSSNQDEPRLYRTKAAAEAGNAVACVVPSRDPWNDLGFSLLAEIGLRSADGRLTWYDARFAIKGQERLAVATMELVQDTEHGLLLSELPAYASLLKESKFYSMVRRQLGSEHAVKTLQSLHDTAVYFSSQSIGVDEGRHQPMGTLGRRTVESCFI